MHELDPLEEFMRWLLKGYTKNYKTFVYAHYGGKR